jgi:hypothetical protein
LASCTRPTSARQSSVPRATKASSSTAGRLTRPEPPARVHDRECAGAMRRSSSRTSSRT